MAAGNNEIIIDTKLDVKGIRTGTEDVEKSFRDLAKEAAKIQREIQQSYAKLDIDASVSNIKDSLAEIKAETDRMSESISDPIEEAFEEGEEASKTASRKMRDDLDDVGDQARKTGDDIEDGIVKNLAKLAGTAAAAISVDAIIEFGKQAIELGSDLQEVQNVVDVTFTTMSDKVNAFAKTASQTAGMSETMAKQYIGTFGAMANSFGFAEEEIFDMSVSLTQLAGDLASFYNLAQDEAAGKLKGIFTGETEALKELGVVMTQTALDAYAMEKGFDKTTDSMTEQEKVALRYQFVMENLSAASGDFVRTSESWANQTRTLALQFEGLMASLGTGLINIFSPAIEFLNAKVMPALNNAAEGFAALTEATGSHKLAGSISALQSTMDGIDQTFQQTAGDIEKNAIMAEIYSTRLKELEESGLTTAEAQREYANIIRELNALYPELNLQIDEQTGYLDENSRAQLENIDAMKQRALYQATEDRYTEALNAQANAILAVQDAEAEYLRVQTDREFIERQLADTTDKTVDELYELYSIEKAIALAQRGGYDTSNIEGYADSTEKLTQKQKNLLSELMAVAIEEAALQRNLDSANLELAEADALTEEYHAALSGVVEQSGLFTQNQEQATEATDELAEAQQELVDAYKANYEASMEAITSQIGLFDELSMKSEMSAKKIVENWKKQQDAFQSYAENLQKARDMGLSEALVQELADGSQESMIYLNELVNGTGTSVEAINAQFAQLEQAKETAAAAMAGVQTEVEAALSGVSISITDIVTEAGTESVTALENTSAQIETSFVTPTKEEIEALGVAIEEAFSTSANSMEESWEGEAEWFESNVITPISSGFEKLRKEGTSVWDDVAKRTNSSWDQIAKKVSNSIDKMLEKIQSLNGRTLTVNFSVTGTPSQFTSVPSMATGTVIPPLSTADTRTKVIASEGTEAMIRQIMQEQLGAMQNQPRQINLNFSGNLAQFIRQLRPYIEADNQLAGDSLAMEVIR